MLIQFGDSSPSATMKTQITNSTTTKFTLNEGNAGAFRAIAELGPDGHHKIDVNTNATYRTYMAATGSKDETVEISYDEILEFGTIVLVKDEKTGKFGCEFRNSRLKKPSWKEWFSKLKPDTKPKPGTSST